MAKGKSLIVNFTKERDTKTTTRYSEDGEKTDHTIGTLYVKQSALKKIGNPETLTVTIESS